MTFRLPEAGNRGDQPVMIDPLSRRNFMKFSGGCASLTSTAMLSQLLNLQLTKAAVADDTSVDGYKALVCIFLLGGNDSFNMITPWAGSRLNSYIAARGGLHDPDNPGAGLALDRYKGELIQIRDYTFGTRPRYGLHAGMPEMKQLYDAGNAAVIANVGSLTNSETTTGNYKTNSPVGLFSHSDLQKHWQTVTPENRSTVSGWGGRMAECLRSSNSNTAVAMNIALGSLNVFQQGEEIVPFVVGPNPTGATEARLLGPNNIARRRMYRTLTERMYPTGESAIEQRYSGLLEQTLATTRRNGIDGAIEFNDATSSVDLDPSIDWGDSQLARQLQMVAKTIGARETLGQGRQIFFIGVGGWDHHGEVIEAQRTMLPMVSKAIKGFYDQTVTLGVQNEVTTFTASDFGRTLSSNGNGSDHAWGGNHWVVGGAVDGRKFYGEYPNFNDLSDIDVGRGRLIPTTSVDEYSAELARWFGVPDNELGVVLPNLDRFDDNLNFMS